jgi:hypothetical protein
MKQVFILPRSLFHLAPKDSIKIASNNTNARIEQLVESEQPCYVYSNGKYKFPNCRKFEGIDPLLVSYLKDGLNSVVLSVLNATKFKSFADRDNYIKNSENKWFLDVSELGKGKTHNSADINPSDWGAERFIFLKNKKYDKNVSTMDGFHVFPARHRGLVVDKNLVSFDGTAVFRNVKPGETPDITANCINPLLSCKLCPVSSECFKGVNSQGYNARYEISQAKSAKKIIAHPLSINAIQLGSSDIVVIDEATALLEFVRSIDFNRRILSEIDYLMISGKVAQVFSPEAIENADFDQLKDEAMLALEQFESISDLLFQEEGINKKAGKDMVDIDREITQLWDFINILGNDRSIYDEASQTVLAPNSALFEELNRVSKIILLDATGNLDVFQSFGINVEILKVDEKKENIFCAGNVDVEFIENMPVINNLSSTHDRETVNKERNRLAKTHDNIGFVSPKIIAKDGDIVTFVNSRGSNLFQSKSVVVCLSVPRMNLGAARNQFKALFNLDHEEASNFFSEYYNSINHSELLQCMGRLRFNRRLDEKLKFIMLAKPFQFNWLKSLGFVLPSSKKEVKMNLNTVFTIGRK